MILPLFVVRGTTVFPGTVRILYLKSNTELEIANKNYPQVAVFRQNTQEEKQSMTEQDIFDCGVIATIGEIPERKSLGAYRIAAYERISLKRVFTGEDGVIYAEVDYRPYSEAGVLQSDIMDAKLNACINELAEVSQPREKKGLSVIAESKDVNKKVDALCDYIDDLDEQALFMTDDTEKRVVVMCYAIKRRAQVIALSHEINKKVTENMQNGQREYLLREQMKVIKDELGDDNDDDEITKKIDALNAPDEVKEKLKKELRRSQRMQQSSPDYSIIRNYIDFALSLPWGQYTQDDYDLAHVRKVLDEGHYGLDKVKERIIEYLAVKKLTGGKNKAPVLCFVGAPGVGKTSVAQAVAKALGKEYVHMSLGGVHDEAEIRGHRKTYVGAMPGRVLSCLSKAKTSNPLFLLDEIDKLTSDMKGDPSSALLEVLDPAQNNVFRDNYLELPYDLSQVFFITTANTLSTIQKPLLDRMEVIEMSGYTHLEKVQIAVRHLIPAQIRENGLEGQDVTFTDDAVDKIIDCYTRESGVRELERKIASVCRKIATQYVTEGQKPLSVKVDAQKVSQYLGVEIYAKGDDIVNGVVGAVNGLAWTSAGGVTMPVEVRMYKGKGELVLTGSLGDVLKESARIAMSIVKSNAERFCVNPESASTTDVHIHLPEGATPKDGPSAGITLTTALISAYKGVPVKDNLGMTGEITLRGTVLAIGGLREKLLAAVRSGIKTVLIPKANVKDLQDVPDEIKNNLTIIPVSDIYEVCDAAFEGGL